MNASEREQLHALIYTSQRRWIVAWMPLDGFVHHPSKYIFPPRLNVRNLDVLSVSDIERLEAEYGIR